MKNKFQDLIDAKEIELDPIETPNVTTAPLPNHGKCVHAIDDVTYITVVDELTTPLMSVKKKLLQAVLFPVCIEGCHCFAVHINGYVFLREGIQQFIDVRAILFEKVPFLGSLCKSLSNLKLEDVSTVAIPNTSVSIPSKVPVKITVKPKTSPRIITTPRTIPYSTDKAITWNYGVDVYYHGLK